MGANKGYGGKKLPLGGSIGAIERLSYLRLRKFLGDDNTKFERHNNVT
jgi:hypothetical protein